MNVKIAAVLLYAAAIVRQDAAAQTTFTIRHHDKRQQIRDFGASGCWNAENIGKFWPQEKKERIAELLFSGASDKNGDPKGIALSSYRFNIGAGTAEQGEASNIPDPNRRAECFLDSNGKYDFTKQAGYQWFVRKAKEYAVPTLVAFVNSPPVFMNQNGLGFKTNKDGHANLKPGNYAAFAAFLATVMEYFNKQGLPVDYLSPANEPQWEWAAGNRGKHSQEGSPFYNEEIANLTRKIDSVFTQRKINTKIYVTEAGEISRLYQGTSWADNQIENFWTPASANYIAGLQHLEKNAVAGHGYWSESTTAKLIESRQQLFKKLRAVDKNLEFWQTEYSFLGNGYKEGDTGKRSQVDCALFLAKVIHHDLTLVNAPVWQFWTAIDPTRPNSETRYNLVSAIENRDKKDGEFSPTKNLWALGNYSRFVRPGMYRIEAGRNDGLSLLESAEQLMLSAYYDEPQHKMVVVVINYNTKSRDIRLEFKNFKKKFTQFRPYITSGEDDLKAYPAIKAGNTIILKPRSVTTLVSN